MARMLVKERGRDKSKHGHGAPETGLLAVDGGLFKHAHFLLRSGSPVAFLPAIPVS